MHPTKQRIKTVLAFIVSLLILLPGCMKAKPVLSPAVSDASAPSEGSSAESAADEANSCTSLYPDYPAQPPRPGQRPNVAYLTFDDGPTEMTPQILDILKEYEVKATFFVVHKSSAKLAAYMKRAYEEGHEIAVHSYTHNYNAIYRSADTFLADFNKTREWICSVTGQEEPTLQYRFPGGSSISQKFLQKPVLNEILYRMGQLNAVHHDWNVSSGDASKYPINKQQVLDNVMKTAGKFNEPVILMHDVERNIGTRDALPEIITLLRERGYVFDTISNIHQPAQHRVYRNTGIPSLGEPYNPPASAPAASSAPPVASVPQPSLPAVSEPTKSSEPAASSSDPATAASSSNTATELPTNPN